ncbi:MAG TPA: hypothetical protein VF910_01080 [Candidatus Bathyarchaeia archaeon]
MNFWLGFFIGIIGSFVISSLALVGWWYLTVGRHEPEAMRKAQEEFEKTRESIRRARTIARAN